MNIRNISPLGQIDLPLIGRVLEPGEVFELSGPPAEELLKQASNFERADKPKSRNTATTEEPS